MLCLLFLLNHILTNHMTMMMAMEVMVMVMVEAMVVAMKILSVNILGFILQLDAIGFEMKSQSPFSNFLIWPQDRISILSRFKDRPVRWSKAKEYCQDLGGKLVEIESAEENEAIVEEIKKHSWSKELKQFWMGLTDRRHEGFFVIESTGQQHTHICETRQIEMQINLVLITVTKVKTQSRLPNVTLKLSQAVTQLHLNIYFIYQIQMSKAQTKQEWSLSTSQV